jgi:uncharacterized protein (TIGR02588 family)
MNRTHAQLVIFGVSLGLVAAIVAALIYDGVADSGEPAFRVAIVGEPTPAPGGAFAVPLTVKNDGGSAAASVMIVVESPEGATAGATIPYVPEGSTRDAVVLFAEEPAAGSLRARVESYLRP